MPTLGPDRTIRARTDHRCDLCGLRIRRGATYVCREGVDGGDHWRLRMHPVCDDATRDWDEIAWECNLDAVDFRYYELDLNRGTVLNIAAEILGGGK